MVTKNEVHPVTSDWSIPLPEDPSDQSSLRENSSKTLIMNETSSSSDSTKTSKPIIKSTGSLSLLSTYFQGMLLGILTNGIVLAIVLTLWLAPSKHSKSDNINDELPSGTIIMFSGNISTLQSSNNHWLPCDGSEVSRSTYQNLFYMIGVTYGSGNGIDTFNLPDFRYRFPLGSNSSNDSQLASGGDSFRVLTLSQMPPHNHASGTLQALTSGVHTHTYSDPGHNHGGSTGDARFSNGNSLMTSSSNGTASEFGNHQHTISTDFTNITIHTSGAHTHSITGAGSVTGGGQPFSIMPPYQTIHFIIRV